jgi:RNA polymerase-associated protein RTF1
MLMISDSKPIQDDVRVCLNQMKNRRADAQNVLSKKEAKKMWKMQDQLVKNYTYTVQDIQKSINVNKKLSKTISNIGAEKTKAAIAVKAAETQLEEATELVDELSKKLLEVDPNEEDAIKDDLDDANSRVKALQEELQMKEEAQIKIVEAEKVRRERMGGSTKNQHWAKVNERAKAANKLADVDAYKSEAAAPLEGAESATKDLFARRKVKPKILWDHGQYKDENKAKESSKQKEMAEKAAQEERDDLSKRRDGARDRENGNKKKLADQINDLAIEEEALTAGLMEVSHKKISATRVRKGISIQEYLERKTAGTL